MTNVKQAAAAAEAFVRNVYPVESLRNLRIEEIERSPDGRAWSITLGWNDSTSAPAELRPGRFAELLQAGGSRTYKTFQVDAESGEVTSMKIRAVA